MLSTFEAAAGQRSEVSSTSHCANMVCPLSAGVFGNEMHSPILCIGQGIPAIVCRWAEQTSKGLMWRDIGLGDWLFDFDNDDDVARLPAAVLALAQDPAAARAKAAESRRFVQRRQQETMAILASQFDA